MSMTMRAAIRDEHGLALVERPRPSPAANEVLVRVHAAALNRADLGLLAGLRHGAHGGTGAVLGLEWAGIVEAVGAQVDELRPGQPVMGSGKAAFADYVLAEPGRVLPLPRSDMGFVEAATLPVALQTMHNAIVTNGRLRAGETVLVQGASSGVGLMALQLARHFGAARVIGSSTTPERRARLAEYGADLAIDSRDEDWPAQVSAATGGHGADLIVDQLAGRAMNGNLAAAALCGRIVNVGRLAGRQADFDFDLHALKRIHYIGVTFRTRTPEEVATIVRRMRADLWPALQAGALRLPVAGVYPFEQLGDALAAMAANRHFGKLVVTLGD